MEFRIFHINNNEIISSYNYLLPFTIDKIDLKQTVYK